VLHHLDLRRLDVGLLGDDLADTRTQVAAAARTQLLSIRDIVLDALARQAIVDRLASALRARVRGNRDLVGLGRRLLVKQNRLQLNGLYFSDASISTDRPLMPIRLCGAPHNRNYAERPIMQSARRDVAARRELLIVLTPHNSAGVGPCSAWPEACRARGSGPASASVAPWRRGLRAFRSDRLASRPPCFAGWHVQARRWMRLFSPLAASLASISAER
jgi:hypothetical protein